MFNVYVQPVGVWGYDRTLGVFTLHDFTYLALCMPLVSFHFLLYSCRYIHIIK